MNLPFIVYSMEDTVYRYSVQCITHNFKTHNAPVQCATHLSVRVTHHNAPVQCATHLSVRVTHHNAPVQCATHLTVRVTHHNAPVQCATHLSVRVTYHNAPVQCATHLSVRVTHHNAPVQCATLLSVRVTHYNAPVTLPCPAGRRADGAAEAVHSSRDGAGAHGAEPVQGALHGVAGGSQVDGDDQGKQGRLRTRQEEQAVHMEVVSAARS